VRNRRSPPRFAPDAFYCHADKQPGQLAQIGYQAEYRSSPVIEAFIGAAICIIERLDGFVVCSRLQVKFFMELSATSLQLTSFSVHIIDEAIDSLVAIACGF
jgi:hypothetical protein